MIIRSDGTREGTFVLTNNGDVIDGIISIFVEVDVDTSYARIFLEARVDALSIQVDDKKVKIVTDDGQVAKDWILDA